MTTELLIIGIFCRVGNVIGNLTQHSHAKLHPSELVTLAMLYGLKDRVKRSS